MFAEARPLCPTLQNEARFVWISDRQRRWRTAPAGPLVPAILRCQCAHAIATPSPNDGKMGSLVLQRANSDRMRVFLGDVAQRHARENIVTVLDGPAGIAAADCASRRTCACYGCRHTCRD
jgi:hypothetical protein